MKHFALCLLAAMLAACGRQTAPVAPESPSTATAVPATPVPSSTPEPTAVPPSPEPTPTQEVKGPLLPAAFTYLPAPVVTREPTGAISHAYINPGAVLFADGQFHMFFNSFTNWPGEVSVGYLTSADGVTWTAVQDEPVFSSADVPFARPGADVSSVLRLDDGTWVMYFHTVNTASLPSVIGRATAVSPLGPWVVDPDPVLLPGSQREWDQRGPTWPSVVKTADGFLMFYGIAQRGQSHIGLAVSTDGRHWTKYNDPTTTEAPFAESDPVLTPDADWEEKSNDRPRVQLVPGGLIMIYQAGSLVKRGLAFSQNGIHWTKYEANPILTDADFPKSGSMWDTSLLYHGGTFYYYTELGSMAGTDVYLATAEEGTRP